jgi:predicted RNA-binding protein with PUA-like domain
MVDVKLVRKFDTPIKLSDLKKEPELAGMELLKRGSRLSVQPVEEEYYKHIMQMAEKA